MSSQPFTLRRTRRATLHLIVVGGASALLAACTSATPTAPAAPSSTGSTPSVASTVQLSQPAQPTLTAQPKRGGRLRSGYLGNILNLDGHNYTGNSRHIFHVFDRLILLDEKLTWLPRLAES